MILTRQPVDRSRGFVMRHVMLALFGWLCLTPIPSHGEELRPEVLTALRGATFEVVVEKPKTDSLTYEKPLPLDLLPYRERHDQYFSAGTAFALEGGQFVSAAHVVRLGSASVRERIALRDADGHVIALDQVVKFSMPRDFVVFTVRGYRPANRLPVNTAPATNDKVFAVGNALGGGVIVRDGLYTSETPEEDSARWQWLRFSAAASPGNSGGPLVDQSGRVIGVVLRKSPNENLNFALPIAEVLRASTTKAEVSLKATFKLDVTDQTLRKKLDETIDLPAGHVEFGRTLQARLERFNDSLSQEFLSTYKQEMFPLAAGAESLLYQSGRAAPFPRLVTRQEDGTWAPVAPQNQREAEIGRNGHLSYGGMGNFLYMRLRTPDDTPLAQLNRDSKAFMDLIL